MNSTIGLLYKSFFCAMCLCLGTVSVALAVEPSAYTLTEVGETDNWNYYDIVNGTKTYYQIEPKSGTHYSITTDGTTDFSIKSIKPGTDSYSYHVTPQGDSQARVGVDAFTVNIGTEGDPVVFHSINVDPIDPDKGGAVYNHDNTEGHSIYADFVSNETQNYGGGVRNGYHSSAFIDKIVGNFVKNKAGTVGGAIANGADCDSTYTTVITEIIGNFIGNTANRGGAIYNQRTIAKKITGDFLSNTSGVNGGAISNTDTGTIGNTTDSTSGIFGNFVSNSSINGGAIYNEGTISNIKGDFILNTATTTSGKGGAIYNHNGTIKSITGNFKNNSAGFNGGAIYNFKQSGNAKITSISGNFSGNSANGAGAIYNNGEIDKITGDFESNSATANNGGAISNENTSARIGYITGNFKGNHADTNAGAIYNGGTIGNSDGTGGIIGNFENNSATNWGGAIVNGNTINKVMGNFTKNSAKIGGAVYNAKTINFVAENGKNITFSGNYVTDESGNGGAIFNATTGTVGLYASAEHSITFTGDTTGLPSTARNVDSIHNIGVLNINGNGTDTYAGTVNLYNVTDAATAKGTTNIYGGTVNVKGTFTQKDLNLKAGTFRLGKGGTVTNLNAEGGALSMSIADASYVNTIDTLTVQELNGDLTSFGVDYDATSSSGLNMDKIIIETGNETGSVKLTSVNVIRDAEATAETLADGKFLDGTLGNITDNTETTSTTTSGGWKYTFTPSSKGVVSVTRAATDETLAQVIQNATGSSSYSINTNPYTTNENLGSLAGDGRIFAINGNGNTIDGNGYAGVKVNSGQTLTINNASMQNFKNSDCGGAIYNEGTISNIKGDFILNTATSNGGAINNNVGGSINNITSNFSHNSADNGGAIYNINGTINNIKGNFESNSATKQGGAINNTTSGKIGNITGDFKGNHADGLGGAIYNGGTIENITGDFENNYTASTTMGGGAIANTKTINISTSDEKSTILFNGNYITNSTGKGGAIWNNGLSGTAVGLYAKGANDTITFVGGTEDGKYDIDGIYNQAILNINGFVKDSITTEYLGTVNLYNVDGTGTTNIYGGKVNVKGTAKQEKINVVSGELENNGMIIANNIDNAGVLTANDNSYIEANVNGGIFNSNGNNTVVGNIQNGGASNPATLKLNAGALYMRGDLNVATTDANGGTLNLADGVYRTSNFGNIVLGDNMNLLLDSNIATGSIDQIRADSVLSGDRKINITLNMPSRIDAVITNPNIKLNPIAEGSSADLKGAITFNSQSVTTPIFTYRTNYDPTTGLLSVAAAGGDSNDYNPYLYAPSAMAHLTAATAEHIASLAMAELDVAADTGKEDASLAENENKSANSHAWLKVTGFSDDVKFKHFQTVDSRILNTAFGFNTDTEHIGEMDASMGVYAGALDGKHKYARSTIEQEGGYVGLSARLAGDNAFLSATVNGGLLKNKDRNMYGTDHYDTRWLGLGLKSGYDIALAESWMLQPNLYAGYTFVGTEDNTSDSGVKVSTDDLHLFQIAPGLKLSHEMNNGWRGYFQAKYVVILDNGGKTDASRVNLPGISTKNYLEYGLGVDKALTAAWSLGLELNRRNAGRTGWSGSAKVSYQF